MSEPTFDARANLEDRAAKVRAELARTLEALDARGRQVAHVSRALQRLAIPVVLVGVVGASALVAIRVATTRKAARALPKRIGAALEPARKALFGDNKPSISSEVLRKVTVVVAGVVATELAKRAAKKSFDGKPVLPILLRRSPAATSATPLFRAPPKSTTDRRVVVVESSAPRWAAHKRQPRTTRGIMR